METKTTKNIYFSVKARLLLMSALPALIIGIAVLVTGIIFMKAGMEQEVLTGLLSSAYAYRDTGILNKDREFGDSDIETELKELTGYDFTWFEGDTRKNSSLGSDVIKTKATETVINEVIGNHKEFTSTKTEVAGEDYFVAYVPVTDSDGKVIGMSFTGVSRETVEAQITKSIIIMITIAAIVLIIAIIIALRASFRMSSAIKAIEESVTKLSNGEFVELEDKHTNRLDEIGQASKSTNNLIKKLTEVLKDIRKASELAGLESNEVAQTSEKISLTTDGIANAVHDIADGAADQSEDIQNATVNMQNLSEAIQNVAKNSEHLAFTAEQMNEAGNSSSDAIKKLSGEMSDMQVSVNTITKTMHDTNDAVQRVNEKTDNITSISSQTNLLALNAAIEAARAGDAGKGFAVVAEEIGKLAVESANTAKEIREEMQNLLNQSNESIVRTEDVSSICKKVLEVLQDTEKKINKLIKNVETTVDGVSNISALTEECEALKVGIVDVMSNLSAISEENAAASEETAASMHEVNESVVTLTEASKKLKEVAEELDKDLRFFKL